LGKALLRVSAKDEPFYDLFLVFLDLNLMAMVISRPMSAEQVEVDPVLVVPWGIEKTGLATVIRGSFGTRTSMFVGFHDYI
jgi:hypothetical protein